MFSLKPGWVEMVVIGGIFMHSLMLIVAVKYTVRVLLFMHVGCHVCTIKVFSSSTCGFVGILCIVQV